MTMPDHLPSDAADAAETAGMETRLCAGMRRAPMPEGVALRLAAARPGTQSRRGLWTSRIVSAATVALCAGLLWHFTSSAARVTPGGEDEKAPHKEKDDGKQEDADRDRVVQHYELKALVEKARANRDVMRGLFPERAEPELGLEQPKAAEPTDAEIRERAVSIAKNLLGARAEIGLDEAKGGLRAKAPAATQSELQHLLKLLRGDFDNEKRIVVTEFRTYELNENQFAKLMPEAIKAEASTSVRTLSAQALDALVRLTRELKIETQLAPRMTTYPGQGASVGITTQRNHIASYDISDNAYDPEIKSYFTGCRYTARGFPASDGVVTVQVQMMHVAETGVTTQYIKEKVPGGKDEEESLRLPIQVPQLQTTALPSTVLRIPADGGAAIYTRRQRKGGKEGKDAMVLLTLVCAKSTDLETELFSNEPVIKDDSEKAPKAPKAPDTDKMKFIDVPVQR